MERQWLITDLRKKEDEIVIWTWEKEKKETKKFSEVEEPELSVHSEQAMQCK